MQYLSAVWLVKYRLLASGNLLGEESTTQHITVQYISVILGLVNTRVKLVSILWARNSRVSVGVRQDKSPGLGLKAPVHLRH